jgi:tetratricopeptide (TPR) repeat protein
VIRLMHPKDCGDSPLAYWHGDTAVGEVDIDRTTPLTPHLIGSAKLNGSKIRVIFDSGAYRSVLALKAATRAGFKPDAADVQVAGISSGIGAHRMETWIARFDTLDLNGEEIRNALLRVADVEIPEGADLLLGADFFLSHRLYVASRQHKIYFTFNGGRVFDLGTKGTTVASQHDAASDAAGEEADATPSLDAAALRRRGAAFAGRRDFEHAMIDFDQAIKQDPEDAENYFQRAAARMQSGHAELAMEDLDQTLKLKPEHIEALLRRGALRLKKANEEEARADFASIEKQMPNNAGLALAIAEIYERAGHSDEALSRFDRWMTAWPNDDRRPTVLNERCWLRASMGKELDLALADCNAALRHGASNSAFLDSRALVFLRRGEFDKAIADYHAALKLQPKAAWAMYGLGVAEKKKGLPEQGEKDMQAALALQPTAADAFKKMGLAL